MFGVAITNDDGVLYVGAVEGISVGVVDLEDEGKKAIVVKAVGNIGEYKKTGVVEGDKVEQLKERLDNMIKAQAKLSKVIDIDSIWRYVFPQ